MKSFLNITSLILGTVLHIINVYFNISYKYCYTISMHKCLLYFVYLLTISFYFNFSMYFNLVLNLLVLKFKNKKLNLRLKIILNCITNLK